MEHQDTFSIQNSYLHLVLNICDLAKKNIVP